MKAEKPSYKDLEKKIAELEKECLSCREDNTARALLNANSEAAYLMEPDGTFIMVNKAAAENHDTDIENMIGRSYKEFIDPDEIEPREVIVRRIIKEKQTIRMSGTRKGKIFDYSVAPVLNANGDVHRIAVLARDITREAEYEKEMFENRHYLNVMFNSTLSGVIVVDADDHRIVDINTTALEMIGRNKKDVVGKACYKFVCSSEEGSCPIADLGQVVDKSERKMITADNGERTILKTIKPLKFRDKKYYIESFIDITELKEAEDAREELIKELTDALEKVKMLSGMMPICAKCKKIRDDKGYWNNLEAFIEEHSEASFSHGLCPHCAEELYGDQKWYIKGKEKRKKQK